MVCVATLKEPDAEVDASVQEGRAGPRHLSAEEQVSGGGGIGFPGGELPGHVGEVRLVRAALFVGITGFPSGFAVEKGTDFHRDPHFC